MSIDVCAHRARGARFGRDGGRFTRCNNGRAARAGGADSRLVALLLLVALAAVGGWWAFDLLGDDVETEDGVLPIHGEGTASPGGTGRQPSQRTEHPGDEGDPERVEATGDVEPGVGVARGTLDPNRFDGPPGTIRGTVQIAGDEAFPQVWKLILEPSNTLVGREHAERREIEFLDGTPDFEVTGLPLAGYDVRAEAPGMNGYAVPVLLERRNPHHFVNLQLARAGFLEGVVLDVNSVAVEGLPLTLESLSDGRALTTETDVVGNFRFDTVSDGQYKLHYGHPFSPVREPRSLQFRAPGMTLPPATVPELAGVWILVLDATGGVVEGAVIRGTGTAGGYVEGTTDAKGLLLVRNLPPGRYRFRASHDEHGSQRQVIELAAGDLKEATVTFR